MAVQAGPLSRVWHEHRPKLLWGSGIAIVSVVFVIGAWFLFDTLVAPPIPDLETAEPEEVADFLVDRRGWRKLSVPERKQWLIRLVQTHQEQRRADALESAIRRRPLSDRQVFVDGFFEVAMPEVMAKARQFNKLPARQRGQFLQDQLTGFNGMSAAFGGLATPFGAALPNDSPGWTKMLVEKTSPSQRSLAKPYIEGLTNMIRTMRGGERRSGHGNARPARSAPPQRAGRS